MEYPAEMAEPLPVFYVGQHETKRSFHVTEKVLRQAHDCNYDMLTTPITTPHFHANVVKLLKSYFEAAKPGTQGVDETPYPLVPPLTPLDTPLTPNETVGQLIAVTSPWIDLGSPDPVIAHISRQVFSQEIAYAAFCGVTNVMIQGPRLNGSSIAQYARSIQEALSVGAYIQLHIFLPMIESPENESEEFDDHLSKFVRAEFATETTESSGKSDLFGTWDAWNVIRDFCNYNSRLGVALILPRRLPPIQVQSRWYSEPLRLLCFPASSFLINARGSQVLSRPHQLFLSRCMRLRTSPWLLLVDVGQIPGLTDPEMLVPYADGFLSPSQTMDALSPGSSVLESPTPAEAAQINRPGNKKQVEDPTPYLSYIRYLQRNQPPKSMIERFGAGYQDYLQSPLQPLADNLESITYEVFEKDPIKYEWYERAITKALADWKPMGKSTSSASGAVVIAVVGAGRGPLVTRAIKASQNSGVEVEMYAVEKNPNAYVLLQRHNEEDWNRAVTVIKSDMRSWKGPLRPDGTHGHVDILVSELLGSFADNELSPECLDGVQHVLNPENGISIPASYTAHLTPIAAPRLHADISARMPTDSSSHETPWVVMLHAINYLSVTSETFPLFANSQNGNSAAAGKTDTEPFMPDVRTTWQFVHPAPASILAQSTLRRGGGISGGGGSGAAGGDGANEHNTRFARMKFSCKERGVCHGLAGYFETVLYSGPSGTVELSTNPVTMDQKSKDMISWFPIFFSLKSPIYVPDNSELEISMWRQTDDRKVWYEWLIESFVMVGDQRLRIGVSDLHSSKKNGCLM